MIDYDEDCFFFPSPRSGQRLYGGICLPREARATGVLVVTPIGRERLRAYRETANLARYLATGGFPVLRFDFGGEGESDGTFERTTLESRLDDIVQAAAELRARAGLKSICLLGLHLGSLLAALAAERAGASRLVLCDPITNGPRYAKNLFRSNILIQSQYLGEVQQTEVQLRSLIEQGGSFSVYGFPVAAPLITALEQLDASPALQSFSGTSALLYFAPQQAPPKPELQKWQQLLNQNGGSCETVCVTPVFSWTSRKHWQPRLESLNHAVRAWLADPARGGVAEPAADVPAAEGISA